ncbi:uncharacterized protein N7484_007708 [Penicillium longicatenatum]|uniref:uncharacterized protein n=1 Tax=Penicillium longicatenatum TaxID=1561947 RepID=UPI0025488398|nr:uncharacterized protein N7484_007708 [Penicillium longicatenatum]KAJ5639846.1 hypothetical protein N7484_007708 [Penicillium longicatenatum]
MSAVKRTQESLDSDEEQSDSGLESAGSSPHPQSRKRPRRSNTPSERNDETSDSEASPRSSPLPENVMMDDEELELHQTQIIQEKYAQIHTEVNTASDHGILESVDCYNFMCHEHFSVTLGPLINFICGKNGSGKSAILTALTLCLGGKASATNRGQSLKNFIKEGKENSNIVVRIKNQGEGAYRPEVFGKSIIVERHFNRSGSSGFKIKAEKGNLISTKKAELDAITDYFSLQIDNPMNVLSQDSARQFLSTSSPAEKYKFFVKGVQLEQLDQDYRLIEESVDQMEEKMRNTRDDITQLKSQRDIAKKRLEYADRGDALRDRIRNLRNQMAWAQVEEQERIRDSLERELAKADELIVREDAALGGFDARFQAVETEAETAKEHADEAGRVLAEARGKLAIIEERQREERNQRTELQVQQRQIREYIKEVEGRIAEGERNITAETERLAEVSNGGYARKQEECQRAVRRATTARQEYDTHRESETGLREELQRASKKAELAKEACNAKERDYTEAEERLRSLRKQNGQRRTGFHEKMPTLKRAILQENSWTTPPIGPIGDHITLLKAKWSSILENSFGGTLGSFIVATKRDQNTLSNIMRQVGCTCPILIGTGGDIDTSATEPDPRYDTALRVLEIDHPMVRRQLIINHSVEQMLLIENLEEASAVLFDGERPLNVKRCYCIDARDRRKGHHISYNRSGDPNQAPVGVYPGNPRMKSDAASQISAQEEVVQDLKHQLNDLKREYQTALSFVQTCERALTRHERTEHELKVAMQRMEDESEALRDALDKENAEEDGRIDSLQVALQEAKTDLAVQEGSFKDAQEAMKNQMQIMRETMREMGRQTTEVEVLTENARVAESERSVVSNKRQEILSEKNAAIARIQKQKEDRDKIHAKREELVERVLSYIEKASMVSARVSVGEGDTAEGLDYKLHKLQNDLKHHNQHLGASRDEVAAEARRTEATYLQAIKQNEELTAIAQTLKNTLHDRKKRWEIFRSHISSRAKAQFTYLLSERSFRGRLLTDHNKKLLDLQVEPDITKDDSTGRGAKTLSGGEKSFSQVCLLLALWEAMGSPIRCLDEFDVYMDHINRKMAIDMLMMAARRSIGRQFIMITPGSKADITIAPDVRVVELAEPERGQTTLPFQGR